MTRKKVKLAYITNDSARKATFKKRKKGLMKKVSELSTLCGIDACAIVYSPYDAQPEVWPSPIGVQRVVAQFKRMPEMEQSKKMVNQDSFLRQRIMKATEQLKRLRKDNREKEMTQIMFQCLIGRMSYNNFSMMDLNDLGWLIEQYVKEINRRQEILRNNASSSSTSSSQSAVQLRPSENMQMDMIRKQQWIMDVMNNPQENNMGFGGAEMALPFGDLNHNHLWNNGFYP